MTNKSIIILVISILTSIFLFSGCSIYDAQDKEADTAQKLYKYRSDYIGDNSNASGLVGDLPYGEYKKGIELSTSEKPYGLKVIYNVSDADVNMTDLKKEFYNNSLIIFSLIENVDYIDFVISGRDTAESEIHQYHREMIEESGINNLFSYSKDEQTFRDFLNEKVYITPSV